MGETLGIIHHEIKFVPICRPLKLENKLSISTTQEWGTYSTAVIATPIPKGRTFFIKDVISFKQFQNSIGKISLGFKA